jgi:serine/threonine-protein kinase ULK/ATG1
MGERIQLRISARDCPSHSLECDLDWTSQELVQAAAARLGISYSDQQRGLYAAGPGTEKWLRSRETVRSQGVVAGARVVVRVPPEMQSVMQSQPAKAPSRGADLSRYYVNVADYEMGRRLGEGSFGSVFEARHRVTGQRVAFKEVLCDVRDERSALLFEREVLNLANARHEALLSLHGCTPFRRSDGGGPCILTPLMPNGSVDRFIADEQKGKPRPEWTPTRKHIVLYGCAAGMEALHRARIIHRDFKPANILLTDLLEPKIADFGFSKHVAPGETKYQSMLAGTPLYTAPEVHLGEDFSWPVDVYSFGMSMYAIVTGITPFSHLFRNLFVLAQKVTEGMRPSLPATINPTYSELISHC